MASPAADPKLAPLADELKEFALTLDRGAFPKNFFCALCDQLAVDSYKLLCCNKVICSACHSKLQFPTTCPSCDHSPVEADSCPPNKALRNTMRVWLQKAKTKEEKKAAAAAEAAATPAAAEPTPAPSEAQAPVDAADKPAESVEEAVQNDESSADAKTEEHAADDAPRSTSAAPQPKEVSDPLKASATAPDEETQEGDQDAKGAEDEEKSVEPGQGQEGGQNPNGPNGQSFPNGGMMNGSGMSNQFGFGFNGQGNNFGMGMNGMPNMMNSNWNNMGYGMNNMNGMFGFGGNMGMGMNDMSMNYGGNFGNGWNGMGGGGYGFNGYNQMGGYNQSGAYPEMMGQYPKNNMSNQNRFQGNGPGNFAQQQNRSGSFGAGFGQSAGAQHTSRPGSRAGPNTVRRTSSLSLPRPQKASRSPITPPASIAADNAAFEQSEAGSRAGTADPTAENQGKDEQASASASQQGKAESATAAKEDAAQEGAAEGSVAGTAEDANAAGSDAGQSALNPIQTVESVEMNDQGFNPGMMGGNMQFPPQMMNSFNAGAMNGGYNHHMGNMGYHNNNFGMRGGGGFNNAYGAATVLTGEPRGVGVAGAPTGPRAMREGRPNTGFSSRANNVRFNPPPAAATPATEAPAGSRSPPRRVRSRSPVRDESLRVKDKSPSRSRAGSQARPTATQDDQSADADRRDDRRDDRARSRTPQAERDDDEHRKERRRHRSSRHDEHDERDERDDHDSRGSRGDRTRSASADSKYRSRRDKDKSRSSRSHRDRSREHKRRHRSRSRSVVAEENDDHANDDSSARRKDRSDRDRDRERYRDRSRSRDRDRKDRKDRDYDDDKYRSRDRDRDRRRRRDRESEDEERDYVEEKYRSSRRSRRDRDVSPPANAPTGPSADNFSIRGASRPKTSKSMAPPQPPTGPRALQPPKGPAADRDRDRRHSRKSSMGSVPSTPTETAPQDHYAAEREKNARARDLLERSAPSDRGESRALHSRVSSTHHSSSRPGTSSKRSRDDYDDDERERERDRDRDREGRSGVPSGPASGLAREARDSKRKKSDAGGTDLASVLTKGLRKKAGAPRRGGVRTEGEVERELERVERERDGRRW